jgi:hypothetical protein
MVLVAGIDLWYNFAFRNSKCEIPELSEGHLE